MNKKFRLALMSIIAGSLITALNLMNYEPLPTAEFKLDLPELGLWENERNDGGYFTIVDEDNNVLDKTIRVVYQNDEFIAANNRHYRVEKVEGDLAYAKLITENALPDYATESPNQEAFSNNTIPVQTSNSKNLIALYHTHTDESYVPSDGAESIPAKGGIYKVGESLASKLKEKGVETAYDKTPHEPHDSGAYRRSRRTAVNLMQKGPAAIIDIHRDGVPDPNFYYNQVAGVDVTKVRLVVGRQNENMQANLDFAKRVKAELDKYYPGLVKGIFMARGNYNQDLSPRSMLIEVGTHTNQRELAEKGASLFADAIPVVLGIAGFQNQQAPSEIGAQGTKGDWSALWWVLGLVLLGGGAFLLISTGSLKGSFDKLKQFSSTEWSNFMGSFKKKEVKNLKRQPEREELNDERAEYQKD